VEKAEVDSGTRPGTTTETAAEPVATETPAEPVAAEAAPATAETAPEG